MFYGPVLSRRFGYSLGVDVIPFKVCSYDCVYCQLGPTTLKTIERKSYLEVDINQFKKELIDKISDFPYINYVTFSGSGEPTLNLDIGQLIGAAKGVSPVPVAVLTCGATLGLPGVVEDLGQADIVKVSLDACSQDSLKKINRPAAGIDFESNLMGLKRLTQEFEGSIWLEIMVLKGINDNLGSANRFKTIIDELGSRIDKIHLNTAVRPSGGGYIRLPDQGSLKEIKNILGSRAEIIGKVEYGQYSSNLINMEQGITELVKRRPATIADMASALGINRNEAIKICDKLMSEGKIRYSIKGSDKYYVTDKERI